MIPGAERGRRVFGFDRPAIQWDAARGSGALTVRLFGALGARELAQVAQAVAEHGLSPRDLVLIDFEQVAHIDYRAIPDFARAIASQANRGAEARLVGMSRYLRDLFDVAGQGPVLRRLEWTPDGEAAGARRAPWGRDSLPAAGAVRRGIWS